MKKEYEIKKIQTYMNEHKELAGDCNVCLKYAYQKFFKYDDSIDTDSCASECLSILKALKIEQTPSPKILNLDDGVYCQKFFYWFLKIKPNVRATAKI